MTPHATIDGAMALDSQFAPEDAQSAGGRPLSSVEKLRFEAET